MAVVVAVGEVAVGEDVDSDHIHKCKWHLISQILLDLYGVGYGLHNCITSNVSFIPYHPNSLLSCFFLPFILNSLSR